MGKETWEELQSVSQLDDIVEESKKHPVVLFKHSTRCSISHMAKSRLEGSTSETTPKIYYLDLIRFREVSNAIASRFGIEHQSPQVILLKDGQPIYNASHGAINMNNITAYG